MAPPNPATAGVDYTSTNGTISFAAGQTQRQITVQVIGDTASEPDETFNVTLSNIVGATASTTTAPGTILNNDGLPGLVINDVSLLEGNSGAVNAVFTVSLSAPSGQTVTVLYATSNGTAQAGLDYSSASASITFAPGQTVQQVTVQVLGDTAVESEENFFVNLSNAVNAVILQTPGVGIIEDNEQANLIMTGAVPAADRTCVRSSLRRSPSSTASSHTRRTSPPACAWLPAMSMATARPT